MNTPDPLSTRAARLLEIHWLAVNAFPESHERMSRAIALANKIAEPLLAELTAAEGERDRLKAEHNEASTRAAYTNIALIAERDSYKDQLTATREALRQIYTLVSQPYDADSEILQIIGAALGASAVQTQETP